jgi:phospholipase C
MLRAAASQIKHVVVVMMENRSFDHFLGWLPNANGKQAGLSYTDVDGVSHPARDLAPDWTGCKYNDPDHSYDGGRIDVDNGLMDGFMKTSTADVYAIGNYDEADNHFFPKFARSFTTCDMYFPSMLGPPSRTASSNSAARPTVWTTAWICVLIRLSSITVPKPASAASITTATFLF